MISGMLNFKTTLGRLRAVGMFEGVSLILLMGIAMPLKYLAGIPEGVQWVGWIHGILFIVYCLAILQALLERKITFVKSVLAFVAAFVPFGPFVMDRFLAPREVLD